MPNIQKKGLKYDGSIIETRNILKVNYQLDSEKIQRIKDGIVNTSFIVSSTKKKLVFRVYQLNNKTLKDIEHELILSKMLSDNGLPVPKIQQDTKGNKIVKFKLNNQIWYGVMFEYLSGRHLESTDTTLINEVAELHARLHILLQDDGLKKSDHFRANLVDLINSEFSLAHRKLKVRKAKDVLSRLNNIRLSVIFELKRNATSINDLPRGNCHLDYDSSNILTNGNKISGIIDFDDMAVAPFIADIAFSLWWWLFFNDFDENIFKLYLKSYGKVRLINKKELSYLCLFLRARNIFLALILFVNQKKIETSNIEKSIAFDNSIKKYEKHSFSQA